MDDVARTFQRLVPASGPGTVVAIASPGVALPRVLVGGRARRHEPMTEASAFRLASVTKPFTAAVILRWAEEGRLDLEDPITQHLDPDRLGLVATPEVADRIRIRHLLEHTSGLPNYFSGAFVRRLLLPALVNGGRRRFRAPWPPEALLAAAPGRARAPPGRDFAYSDTGYVVLGMLIEQRAGLPLHHVYRAEILHPLGLTHTWMEGREADRGALSHPFLGPFDVFHIDPTADWGGGGLASTAAELAAFGRALFGGGLFRGPETLERMRDVRPVGAGAFVGLTGYGLGLGALEVDGVRLVGHGGTWGAFCLHWPERDVVLAGTSNRYGPFARASQPLIGALLQALGGRPAPRPARRRKPPPAPRGPAPLAR